MKTLYSSLLSLLRHKPLRAFLIAACLAACTPSELPKDPPVNNEDTSVMDTPVDTADVNDTPTYIGPIAEEDAFTAVRNMKVGWNLGNTLDSHDANGTDGDDWRKWETYWGQSVTRPELMHMMKAAGFDAIRVPVTWGIHMDADGKVYPSWMNRVREVVDYVLDAGMYCILNVHHDTGAGDGVWLIADPDVYQQQKARYEGLWRQIAEEFKGYGEKLLFESYNEMLDSSRSWCFASSNIGYDQTEAMEAYQAINSYAQSFVNVVRSTGGNNAVRNLVVNTYGACSGGGTWNTHLKDPLIHMALPEDSVDNHLIFQIHSYISVKHIPSTKAEIDDMFQALNTHLVAKGAPVIIGEWGTYNDNDENDYLVRRENCLEFADYFVRNAKEMGFGTFFWMGISDGHARTVPVFSQPDLAETIVKAYHGEAFSGVYPTMDDYEFDYLVTYNQLWSELTIAPTGLSSDIYSYVRLTLDKEPEAGRLQVKLYGYDAKEDYPGIKIGKITNIPLANSNIGKVCERMTLQYMSEIVPYSVKITDVTLIRKDGTEEKSSVSSFWGCSVDLEARKKVR